MNDGLDLCERVADELTRRGCDFSLLFWLRQADLLSTMDGSWFARDLLSTLSDLAVDVGFLANPECRQIFFQTLRKRFNEINIEAPVSPCNFVCDSGIGGKERCIQKAKDARWPRPYQSYCFQTRGSKNSYFFIFQCWQVILAFLVLSLVFFL